MNETATPTLRDIEAAVCARFGLTPQLLRGPKKQRGIARPRQIAMYLAREMTSLSYPRIAAWFNRDHTTVLFGERRVRQLMAEKPKLAAYVRECRALVVPRDKTLARELANQPLVTIPSHDASQPRLPRACESTPAGEVAIATPGSAGASRAPRQSCEGRRG
ncbi:MAG TPA: helix-turn-helix domain-containing protein [Rhizomicrobium sp.]|nr:helix-turn-helix domain-containing protein [Rhizomicrobium sp.]